MIRRIYFYRTVYLSRIIIMNEKMKLYINVFEYRNCKFSIDGLTLRLFIVIYSTINVLLSIYFFIYRKIIIVFRWISENYWFRIKLSYRVTMHWSSFVCSWFENINLSFFFIFKSVPRILKKKKIRSMMFTVTFVSNNSGYRTIMYSSVLAFILFLSTSKYDFMS